MSRFSHCIKCGKEKKNSRSKQCPSCCRKGKATWNKGLKGFMQGRKTSLETRQRQSYSQIGVKNHMWKGGISLNRKRCKTPFMAREWREKVLERDNSTCTICNKFCVYPQTHHILFATFFPELEYVVANGKTVCYDCHMIIHRKVSGYRKQDEFSGTLSNETILSQAWREISLKVQRILDETKELNSMSVIPARASCPKGKIYAEHVGDYVNQEIKNS